MFRQLSIADFERGKEVAIAEEDLCQWPRTRWLAEIANMPVCRCSHDFVDQLHNVQHMHVQPIRLLAKSIVM